MGLSKRSEIDSFWKRNRLKVTRIDWRTQFSRISCMVMTLRSVENLPLWEVPDDLRWLAKANQPVSLELKFDTNMLPSFM
jgi:hypothetical protein